MIVIIDDSNCNNDEIGNGDGDDDYCDNGDTYPFVCILIIFAIFILTSITATSIAITDANSNPVIRIYNHHYYQY